MYFFVAEVVRLRTPHRSLTTSATKSSQRRTLCPGRASNRVGTCGQRLAGKWVGRANSDLTRPNSKSMIKVRATGPRVLSGDA